MKAFLDPPMRNESPSSNHGWARKFYRDVLGLQLTIRRGSEAQQTRMNMLEGEAIK